MFASVRFVANDLWAREISPEPMGDAASWRKMFLPVSPFMFTLSVSDIHTSRLL